MYGFHVRGSSKFQTKTGSVMTLGWLFLVSFAFVFYLRKFLDKTEPQMQMNRFRSEAFPNVDLLEEDLHFSWSFLDLRTGN
jgi:hypothetical protein